MARYLAQKLGDTLGQSVVVENQPGAAGNAAYLTVSKAPPDGYTLIYATSSLAINAVLKSKVGYDPVRDFAPVSAFVEVQNVLVVPASSPFRTVADLVAFAKQKPGELNYVSLGPGDAASLRRIVLGSRRHQGAAGALQAHHPGLYGPDGGPRPVLDRLDAEHAAARHVRKNPRARGREPQALRRLSGRADDDGGRSSGGEHILAGRVRRPARRAR